MYTVENKIGSYGYQLGKHICEIELKSPCEDVDVPSLCDKILELNPPINNILGIKHNLICLLVKSDTYDLTGDKASDMFQSMFSYIRRHIDGLEDQESRIWIPKVLVRDIGKRPITHKLHYTFKDNPMGATFHGDIIIHPKSFVEDYVDRIDVIQHYFRNGQIVFIIDDVEDPVAEIIDTENVSTMNFGSFLIKICRLKIKKYFAKYVLKIV
jgi:hypothetical protein